MNGTQQPSLFGEKCAVDHAYIGEAERLAVAHWQVDNEDEPTPVCKSCAETLVKQGCTIVWQEA